MDAKQALEEILDEIAGSPLNVWDDVTDRYDEVDRDFGSKNYVLVQHVDHDTVIKLTAEVVQP